MNSIIKIYSANKNQFEEHKGTSSCIFFNDGTFLSGFRVNYFLGYANSKHGFYNRGPSEWGIYRICHDTIKAQCIESPCGTSWLESDFWFKIIDRNTIQDLKFRDSTKFTKNEFELYRSYDERTIVSPAKFTALDNLPDPNKAWIKEESWFWCNFDQYAKWKNNLNNQKQ